MYNPDTEFLFPLRLIPQLRSLRGEEWLGYVDRLQSKECTQAEKYAFVLMMIRMGGCVSCNSDSFRAMRGCTACARQSVKRFRGSDRDLIDQVDTVKKDVDLFLKKQAAGGA